MNFVSTARSFDKLAQRSKFQWFSFSIKKMGVQMSVHPFLADLSFWFVGNMYLIETSR